MRILVQPVMFSMRFALYLCTDRNRLQMFLNGKNKVKMFLQIRTCFQPTDRANVVARKNRNAKQALIPEKRKREMK